MTMKRQAYSSDLSDEEWQRIEPLVGVHTGIERPEKWHRREVLNAMLYSLRTGCQWCLRAHDFPPYGTVLYHFRQWRRVGLWERINGVIREQVCLQAGREASRVQG
ncbi:MAG: transposase [Chloroflexota bacterium]